MAKNSGKADQSGKHKNEIKQTNTRINRLNKENDMSSSEKLRRAITGK